MIKNFAGKYEVWQDNAGWRQLIVWAYNSPVYVHSYAPTETADLDFDIEQLYIERSTADWEGSWLDEEDTIDMGGAEAVEELLAMLEETGELVKSGEYQPAGIPVYHVSFCTPKGTLDGDDFESLAEAKSYYDQLAADPEGYMVWLYENIGNAEYSKLIVTNEGEFK